MMQMQRQPRAQRFGRGAVILRAVNDGGLTDEDIMSRAPSVYADEAHSSRSEKYSHIPTRTMLAGLRDNGFIPVEVRQGGSRDEEKRGFTKHQIRMRRQGQQLVVGGLIPEVILLNSHDGTSSYVMTAGIFRCVCTNGLMVGESVDEVRFPHRGDILGQVIEGAFRVLDDLPRAMDAAQEMRAITLSQGEQEVFARSAAVLRFEAGVDQPEPARLNAPRRSADTATDLWTTFNRVQESLVRGGVPFIRTDEHGRQQRRTTRPVNSIDADRGINRALWELAEGMRQLKQAA